MADLDFWLRAVLLGSAYLAVAHSKIATANLFGRDVPVGGEALYTAAQGFVYRRLNDIAKRARTTEATALAGSKTLADLTSDVRLSINHDALMTEPEKADARAWLLKTLADQQLSDFDKRVQLSDYLLSGRRTI